MSDGADQLQAPEGGASARPSVPPGFQRILLLLGQLNYAWTNTETLLIHFLAGLARVEKETAIVIFLSLNTSRARLDLVERLAKMERVPSHVRSDVLSVTGDMAKVLKHRNRFNHCLYSFDEDGRQARTILMRIAETKDTIRYGKTQPLDAAETENIAGSIRQIEEINRRAWRAIFAHDFPV